jgi:SAM-dependent methyltransferase
MSNRFSALIGRVLPLLFFRNSRQYWETRYRLGGHSGEGSRGEAQLYKTGIINQFVKDNAINSVIEFGCGDGQQLRTLHIPHYVGVDVSPTVLSTCRKEFGDDPSKVFVLLDDYAGQHAELSMSVDVIFHLVEDNTYDDYLARLFAAGTRFVIIYSTSTDLADTGVSHVRHRNVLADVSARFPTFRRMTEVEASLPPPVRFDRGHPTSFFLFEATETAGS